MKGESFFFFIFSASMITGCGQYFLCLQTVHFNQSQSPACAAHWHTHTVISSLKRVFPICPPQHMFVCMVYTEEAEIWISVAAIWLTHTEFTLYFFLCLCFHPFVRPHLSLHMTNTFSLSTCFILDCCNATRKSLKNRYQWLKLSIWEKVGKRARGKGAWKKRRTADRVMGWLKVSFRLHSSIDSHTHTLWVRGQWWVVRLWLHAQLNRMGP